MNQISTTEVMEANVSTILDGSWYLPGVVNSQFKFADEPFCMETTHQTLDIIS
jgi:hypothetical protein